MTRNAAEVLRSALSLTPEERAEIAGSLIDSLEGPGDADASAVWEAEIERRLAQLDAGEVTAVPWIEVRDRLGRR